MILYHGSNVAIEKIDLQKCRPNKDFGRGFYTTTLKAQAERMAVRTQIRFGGEKWVSVFDFDEQKANGCGLRIRHFAAANEDWVEFVLNNRYPRRACHTENHNRDNKYALVDGPVANDDIDLSFNLYEQGFISRATLLERLKNKRLNNQYSFHAAPILNFLTLKAAYHV